MEEKNSQTQNQAKALKQRQNQSTFKAMLTASGPYLNLDRVLLITLAFVCMFTPFIACQNLTPKIMHELGYGKIGFVNLAIIYLTFGLTSLLAVPINRKLGHRMTLFVSSLAYTTWILAFILPAYKFQSLQELGPNTSSLSTGIFSDGAIMSLTLITACLTGFGAGPIWVSNNCYLSECASDRNKGRFLSLFFGFFELSNIIGNLISGALIECVSLTTFYLIMGVMCFFGSLVFLCLRKPIELETPEEEEPSLLDKDLEYKSEKEMGSILPEAQESSRRQSNAVKRDSTFKRSSVKRESYVFDMRKSVSLPSSKGQQDKAAMQNSSGKPCSSGCDEEAIDETMCAVFKFMASKQMLPFIPIIAFDAMSLTTQISLYINFWVQLINQTVNEQGDLVYIDVPIDAKLAMAIKTYVPLGLGMVCGVWPMGILQDKYGHRAALSYIITNTVLFTILLLVQNEIQQFNFWFACFTMFGLGIIDSCDLTYTSMIFGSEFESRIVAAAARNFLKMVFTFIFLGSLALWTPDSKLTYRPYFIVFVILGTFSQLIVFYISKNFKKVQKEEPVKETEEELEVQFLKGT